MTSKKNKKEETKPVQPKVEKNELKEKIISEAILIATGKVRNTFELETAARQLIELEK